MIVDSLSRAAELTLLAVGVTLVYGMLRFANFAHIEFATVGAYLALFLSVSLGIFLPLAAVIAIVTVGLLGVLTDQLIFKRLRKAEPIMLMIASFALGIVLRETMRAIYGPSAYFYDIGIPRPWTLARDVGLSASFVYAVVAIAVLAALYATRHRPLGSRIFWIAAPAVVGIVTIWSLAGTLSPTAFIEFGGIRITPTQTIVIVASVLAMIAFHFMLSRTKLGVAMRATAENVPLAQASGIHSDNIIRLVWLIGTGFAALGGILVGLNTQINADMGVGLIIEVFAAAILGGIGNPYGAMLGALIIGFAENISLFINWGPLLQALGFDAANFLFIPTSYKSAISFVILIAALLIRPQGILGARR
ncbi:MAG: branched-chain amino acid ABC transporter permease [Bauldia sp.]